MIKTLSKKKTQSQTPCAPVKTEDALEAMKVMIEVQNWQGYLHFRRIYFTQGGTQSAITAMIKSLSDELQLVYGRYFQSHKEVIQRVRIVLDQEKALRQAQEEAKWDEIRKVREAEERSKSRKPEPMRKVKTEKTKNS